MANTDSKTINWDEVNFEDIPTETRDANIRAVIDVPAPLVKMAQESWDGKIWVKKTFRGRDPQFVAEFARLMKAAGDHTTPQTSIIVNHEANSIIVEFRATERRGRKPGQTQVTSTNEELAAEVAAHAATAEKRPTKA